MLVSYVQMVYKSCPDLSRLTTGSVPLVDTETEYHAAYRRSTDSNTGHTTAAAAAGAGAAAAGAKDENNNNSDDDDVNEVCLSVFSVIIGGLA